MSEAASLLAKLASHEKAVRTIRGTVSAYREDGLVNVTYGTTTLFGVPCLGSYTNRVIGDVVQVLDLGTNAWMVLGRIGGTDPSFTGPTTQNTGYAEYYLDTLAKWGSTEPGFEGYTGSSGANGEKNVLVAWTYYNGTSNVLNTGVAGKSNLWVTVARSNRMHGQREAVELQLCPHNFNALPSALVLDTDSFSPVVFRLAAGEIRNLKLPSDWFSAISAGTPTIKGFAVVPTTTSPWQSSYAIFSPTSGGFRAV